MMIPETLVPAATPEELLERWLARLNDPTAVKTRHALKDEVGMCANGHLLDVSGFGHWVEGKYGKYTYVFDTGVDWYEPGNDPYAERGSSEAYIHIPWDQVPVTIVNLVTKGAVSSQSIVTRNDGGGWIDDRPEGLPLPEIAAFIRRHIDNTPDREEY